MTTPSSPAPRSAQHPLLIAAAVAVIVFCGAGTAAILGWIPSSVGGTPATTELSEIDRAVLASKLQNGGTSGTAAATASNVAPRTLAALDAQDSDAERNAARYRAAQRADNQREDDLRAARDREEKREAAEEAARRPTQQELDRAALHNGGPATPREPAPRKPAPPRHAASEPASATAPGTASGTAPGTAQERWCNHCGNIESVREVTQRAQGSGLGAAGGAVLGGLLGNQVGGGNGRKLATLAGAVGGAVVGNQVEGNLKATRSYEIRVRLDDGGARTFHQQSAAGWRTGDRVKVVNGTLRSAG